jgi:hypothetical protein
MRQAVESMWGVTLLEAGEPIASCYAPRGSRRSLHKAIAQWVRFGRVSGPFTELDWG